MTLWSTPRAPGHSSRGGGLVARAGSTVSLGERCFACRVMVTVSVKWSDDDTGAEAFTWIRRRAMGSLWFSATEEPSKCYFLPRVRTFSFSSTF